MAMTQWKLRRLAKRAGPDRATHRAMRQALQQAGYLPEASGWSPASASLHTKTVAILATVLMISLMSVTGTYAYVADEVVPDHPLYAVRQTIERVELSLAASPEAKARVSQRLTERRAREVAVVEKKKNKKAETKTTTSTAVLSVRASATSTIDASATTSKAVPPQKTKKKTVRELRQELKAQFEAMPSLKQLLTATTSRRFIERSLRGKTSSSTKANVRVTSTAAIFVGGYASSTATTTINAGIGAPRISPEAAPRKKEVRDERREEKRSDRSQDTHDAEVSATTTVSSTTRAQPWKEFLNILGN